MRLRLDDSFAMRKLSIEKGTKMQHKKLMLPALLMAFTLATMPAVAGAQQQADAKPAQSLFTRIKALDAALFDAFNRCSDPEQLQRHASFFTPDVEFYHDEGGVTWTRDDMIANTRNHACGNYRRELVPGTLEVYPIKGFGAIAKGVHRFCAMDTGQCDGIADFVLIWREQDGQWQITRALSFGHRPNE